MNKKPAKGAYLDILLRSQSSNMGIDNMEGYSIAAPKRAFLDVLYVHKQYHFDNLRPLNWEKVYALLPIYEGNKRMQMIVDALAASAEKKQ